MNKDLQKAIDTLLINDVYLKKSIAECFNEFDPKFYPGIDELETRTKHIVKGHSVSEMDDSTWLVRVFIELGVLLLDSNADPDINRKAIIEAEFVAEYHSREKPEESSVKEYALKNVSYHVWPYWREFLMNQSCRMHLPRFILPAVQFAQNNKVSKNKKTKKQ
ncbi:MAG: preprotein translocase subunit SecB [Methyloglobulus sp.]|nr:preprotein translocase subunit SecB [Methyloglobulus sp.]NOU44169.1 preprotein translocase subunit SecB [Methyloglobulus sp.]